MSSTGELRGDFFSRMQTFAPCHDKIGDNGIESNWQWEVAVRREKVLLWKARSKCPAALKAIGFVNRQRHCCFAVCPYCDLLLLALYGS